MADEPGLRIVLTPVQLSAILNRQHLTQHEIMMNRLSGGLTVAAGAMEMVGGVRCLQRRNPQC